MRGSSSSSLKLQEEVHKRLAPSLVNQTRSRDSRHSISLSEEADNRGSGFFKRVFRKAVTQMDRKSNSLSLLAPPTDDDPSPRPPPTPQIFRYLQPSRPQFRPAPDEPFKGPKPPLGPPKIVFSKLASESFDPSPSRSAKQQQAAEQRSDFVPKEYVDKPPVIVPFSQLPRKPPD